MQSSIALRRLAEQNCKAKPCFIPVVPSVQRLLRDCRLSALPSARFIRCKHSAASEFPHWTGEFLPSKAIPARFALRAPLPVLLADSRCCWRRHTSPFITPQRRFPRATCSHSKKLQFEFLSLWE